MLAACGHIHCSAGVARANKQAQCPSAAAAVSQHHSATASPAQMADCDHCAYPLNLPSSNVRSMPNGEEYPLVTPSCPSPFTRGTHCGPR